VLYPTHPDALYSVVLEMPVVPVLHSVGFLPTHELSLYPLCLIPPPFAGGLVAGVLLAVVLVLPVLELLLAVPDMPLNPVDIVKVVPFLALLNPILLVYSVNPVDFVLPTQTLVVRLVLPVMLLEHEKWGVEAVLLLVGVLVELVVELVGVLVGVAFEHLVQQ
jgi:hypothetical protein